MYAPAVRLAKLALLLAPLFGSLALTGPARADVVMSPPKSCPPGHTPVTSHAGPRCLANAPTNCPAGWTGILGGHCVLDVCDPGGEATCRAGTECKAQDLCGEEKLVETKQEIDAAGGWGVRSQRKPAAKFKPNWTMSALPGSGLSPKGALGKSRRRPMLGGNIANFKG